MARDRARNCNHKTDQHPINRKTDLLGKLSHTLVLVHTLRPKRLHSAICRPTERATARALDKKARIKMLASMSTRQESKDKHACKHFLSNPTYHPAETTLHFKFQMCVSAHNGFLEHWSPMNLLKRSLNKLALLSMQSTIAL